MTAALRDDGKYVRVYYRITNDPKFAEVFGDDHHLSTWLRLLLVADGIWPVSPPIPRTVRRASLAVLVQAELVDLMPQDCYRIHGLDAERSKRAQSARNAAAKRWDSDRIPTPNATPVLVRERERAKTEDEQTPAQGWDEPEGEALTWLARHGCDIRPGNGYHRQLVTAVERFGVNAVIGKFDRLVDAGVKDGDIKGFVFGAIDLLNPKPDVKALEREEREADSRALQARRVAATKRLIAETYREAVE